MDTLLNSLGILVYFIVGFASVIALIVIGMFVAIIVSCNRIGYSNRRKNK